MFKRKKRDVEVTSEKKHIFGKLLGCFLAAAALFAVLISVEKNMLSNYEKEPVILCKMEVPKGSQITEANISRYFYLREVDAALIDENCVTDKKDLLGTVTVRKLRTNEIIRKEDCTKEAEIYSKLNEPAEGSFTAENAGDIVSGTIRKGDRVDIAVVNKDTLEYDLMLQNVYVEDAFTNTGEKVTADMEGTAATMLTIVEEKDNLARFYSALETGNVIVTKIEAED